VSSTITLTPRDVLRAELDILKESGLYKEERIIHAPQGAEIEVEFPAGAAPKKVLNLCSNNYLGLSSHPDVIRAAHDGLDRRGYGMSSVRFICGTQDIHRELERRLTDFLGTEETILFSSCLDANAAIFSTVSNASGEASASGIFRSYFRSRKRFSETIEKESTIPPVMSGVVSVSGRSSPSSRYSRRT